jgi:hypothetical protein
VLAIFNPLTTNREEFITVTTTFPFIVIEDIGGDIVSCQVAPLWSGWLQMTDNKFQVKNI